MFACIYFTEDSSLSVVGRADKNLCILHEWKAREQVEMKWGKKLFHGTIIQIGENEENLTKFANSANNQVLKKSTDHEKSTVLDDLLSYSMGKSGQQAGKRIRVETEKLKESRLQENDSPKKKKVKEQGDKNKCITLAQKRSEKKKKEQTVSLEIEEEINDICNLSAQFSSTSEGLSEQCTPTQNCKPSLAFIGDENHKVPATSVSATQKVQGKNRQEVTNQYAPIMDNANITHKNSPVTVHEMPPRDTPLTATWNVCQNSDESTRNDILFPDHTQQQAPPPKVIELFQLLLHPTVRQYMTKMVEQFPLFGSENRDSPYPQTHYTDLDTDLQLMIPNSQHFNSVPFGSYPSSNCTQLFQSQQSITTQESNTCIRNHFQQYTPMPAGQNKIPTAIPCASAHPIQSGSQYETLTDNHYSSTNSNASLFQSSPIVSKTQISPVCLPALTDNMNQGFNGTSSPRMSSLQNELPGVTEIPRTSPRKQKQRDLVAKSSLENTSKLIGNRSVTIDKDVVAMAVRLSIKSSRPAYTLTMKLMPGLFTNEEMAQSRGQGLLAKKDDLRPVLNKEKISTLKEYVRCWCKTNNLKAPDDTEINEAVTERVSYARKLVKKSVQKQ